MSRKSLVFFGLFILLVVSSCNLTPAVTPTATPTRAKPATLADTHTPLSTHTSMPSATLNPDTVCDPSGCISLSKFSANIDSQLNGQAVGYVSMVGVRPIIVKYGQARTSADPPALAWNTDVPMNIASLSKVLTTIAVLQALGKHKPALTIDDKITSFLPPDWTEGPNVETITFKDLLTHRAGFRENGNGSHTTYAVLQQQIADGVKLSDKAVASYNNNNFAIFRILLPYIAGFKDPGPATRATATADFYINYMRQNVFQPLGIPAADCKPAAGSHPALSYPSLPVGAAHGYDWGDWTLSCGGGGWVLSANDLYKIMVDLSSGHTLLTDAQKTEMNSNCLGWDCSVQKQVDFVGKNGALVTGNNYGLWTIFGIFKGSTPIVVMINSYTATNITDTVVTAFNNAVVPHP